MRTGLAAGIAGAAALLWLATPGANTLAVDGDAIRTGQVVRAAFQDFVPIRGEVAPLHTVVVSVIAGGQVADLIASDGTLVSAGSPLARLTNPSLELDVASRSADIAGQLSAISGQRLSVERNRRDGDRDVADATNTLLKAETELAKKRTLFDKGIVNQAAVDPLAAEVAYQRRRVAALSDGRSVEAGVLADQAARIGTTQAQLRDSLAMVRRSVESLTVRAPVAGQLTAFTLQPGQTLKPGDPIGQIDSDGAWKLVADVDQFYLARTRAGQSAIADINGRAVALHVAKLLPQVSAGRFRIELSFDRPPPALNRGQTLDVRLILGADQPAIVAPSGGWLDGNGATAFVVRADGKRAVRRAISIGRRNPDQVEVTSGLAPGESIVTTALSAYAPYQSLTIR
ncbi:MAG: efflux RND transporter periplasmic adaptor subunit [Sphingomonas sp.]